MELDGIPKNQVMKFHAIAPTSAPAHMARVAPEASMRPDPIVSATRTPKKAPKRLASAASRSAIRGVRARVETEVAIALAESWKPLV